MPKLLDLKLWFTQWNIVQVLQRSRQSGADIPTGLGINIGDTALGNPLRQQPSAYCGGGGGGGGRLDRTALWAGTHSCYHFADIFHAGWDDHKPLLLHSVTGSAKAKRDEERLRTVPARVFGCAPRRSVEVLHLSLESRPWHVWTLTTTLRSICLDGKKVISVWGKATFATLFTGSWSSQLPVNSVLLYDHWAAGSCVNTLIWASCPIPDQF